ncbi:uncharacterized protein LOC115875593 [Sitophilus oryzae]|uniref:Uncharacterized protein LOC115875593 n=1 Tax=Sitophilus oryzae TaxID=7048 RepID=A0A6J2X7I0_SITOR|nr:uncharacterized protein LOC115875593 [Sitophilus oryzae]
MEQKKYEERRYIITQGQRAEKPWLSKAYQQVLEAERLGIIRKVPQAERPGNSREISQAAWQGTSQSVRVSSLEDVDLMTDEEIKAAKLSGISKAKIKKLTKQGYDYIEAKKAVIKANFVKVAERAKGEPSRHTEAMANQQKLPTQGSKRPVSYGSTPPENQYQGKRPKTESKSAALVKIAAVHAGFPEVKMELEKLEAVQKFILAAYEAIQEGGPQVRFQKFIYKPGFLEITCADDTSATWLKGIIPTLKPWEGASLKALEGEEATMSHVCIVFIPDEDGERLEIKRILNRLRISNRCLKTHLWNVMESEPMDKGVLWTFSMDKDSREELHKLGMSPFFGFGKLTFRPM